MDLIMENVTSKEGYFDVDLELGGACNNNNNNNSNNNNNNDLEGCDDNKENVKLDVVEKKVVKEKAIAKTAKKPPKPPRPPRGLSLDSADQKLIRELNELAKLKRARIERMKAVKKAREAKVSSSKNQWFATLLTVLFCLVVLFQGISSKTSLGTSFQGSPISSRFDQSNVISIQHNPTSSVNNANGPGYKSPRLTEFDGGGKQSKGLTG